MEATWTHPKPVAPPPPHVTITLSEGEARSVLSLLTSIRGPENFSPIIWSDGVQLVDALRKLCL